MQLVPVSYKSGVIDYCTTCTPILARDTLDFHVCVPIFMHGIIREKNNPHFPRCDIDVQWRQFPVSNFHWIYKVPPFIVGEDAWWIMFILGGGGSYRHQPKERHYKLPYLVHMIAVCSVLGRRCYIAVYTAWPVLRCTKERSAIIWSLTAAVSYTHLTLPTICSV